MYSVEWEHYPLIYNCDLKTWKTKLKNERLNFENLGFAKMTKTFGFDVGNDLATEFHSSIHQTVKFNNFKLFWRASNLKCDCKLNEIPSLFLDNSFANVSNSTMHVRKWKHFWRLHPPFENKKSKNENCLHCLHSTLSLLSYLF